MAMVRAARQEAARLHSGGFTGSSIDRALRPDQMEEVVIAEAFAYVHGHACES